MAAIWDELAGAALCGRLGASLCKALETRQPRFQRPPSGMYGGWHQYMSKDLRTLAGGDGARAVQRALLRQGRRRGAARTTCGRRSTRGARPRPRARARTDPAQWKRPTVKISFTPLPLVDMQYTNRPSGIHQVMQFAP